MHVCMYTDSLLGVLFLLIFLILLFLVALVGRVKSIRIFSFECFDYQMIMDLRTLLASLLFLC